jgi:CheY-like chemotaxis protein
VNDHTKSFGDTAKSLARNPLGIIALFIVMVYGFASLVTVFAGSFTPAERMPLIYFLVVFPVLVLTVFAWLVSSHIGKLFAPSDFKDERNYVDLLTAATSLAVATKKTDAGATETDVHQIVEAVRSVKKTHIGVADGWRNHILWVDDRPENNAYERQAFEAMGLRFTLAQSTDAAFEKLAQSKFAAIISDMGRREGPREGYVLLDRLRKEGNQTPLFFYAASSAPEHKRETRAHGGQGATGSAQELFEMVMTAVAPHQVVKDAFF